MNLKLALVPLLLLLPAHSLLSQGSVYLVLGSDTGIWDGMDVGQYHCTYSLSLFTDPARNATRVMDPSFRLSLTDSYGTPVKLTWWMMAGNIFRYATNTDVPVPNLMTLYLMKKYQGPFVSIWGDELTLHYHTFVWTDYDGDGRYYWNQARSFLESADDFNVTLAGMLLEENTFPVSFRSGWHAMDNDWQLRLDQLLPYSMHDDYPAKRTDTTEPLDNTYDWSRSSSAYVPFHPSPDDYQVSGSCRGWNLRSTYMSRVDSSFMAAIFERAAQGADQVVCLWAHLPEADFLDNVRRVDASAHKASARYPGVTFRYCTAVEAMQRWRKTADTTRPIISVSEIAEGAGVRWSISSDEPLFEDLPFAAVKDRNGEYRALACRAVGDRVWETTDAVLRADLAKAGFACTDTAGNLSTAIIRYLPDDVYVDDSEPGYSEQSGSWSATPVSSWGTSARVATLGASDSAKAVWTAQVSSSALYSIYLQVPAVTAPARDVDVRLEQGSQVYFTKHFASGLPPGTWVYIGTQALTSGVNWSVLAVARGTSQPGSRLAADVVKFTALVRDRWLTVPEFVDAGELIVGEHNATDIHVSNEGVQPVQITGVASAQGMVAIAGALPVTVPPMGTATLACSVMSSTVGPLNDTLVISSDDPHHAVARIPVRGSVQEYFVIVDDRDSLAYEEVGTWSFSNAKAYGTTSRYVYPDNSVAATFSASIRTGGLFRIQEIVPTTANASVRARYILTINGDPADSVFVDQNAGSGAWVTLMERFIPARAAAVVRVSDAMSPVESGKVLRADAVRFQWISDGTGSVAGRGPGLPAESSLAQNYPNPFNPTTVVRYQLSVASDVKLVVYDILGREVAILVNEKQGPGSYEVMFDSRLAAGGQGLRLSSGVYFYRLIAGQYSESRKMVLMK